MIASKLAAMAPERVASLALLNTTGGGYQCIPKVGVVDHQFRLV
jgi:pimeloyl-ACP methyl ester carboxylesterase